MSILNFKIVLALTAIISGCSFSKQSPEEVKANAFDEVSKKMRESTLDTRSAAMTAGDFIVSFESGSEPNQYSLVVTAPRAVPKLVLNVGDMNPVETSNSNRVSISMAALRSLDIKYAKVNIKTHNSDGIPASDNYLGEYLIPRDYIFEKSMSLDNHFKPTFSDGRTVEKSFAKVIFKKDVKVNLDGHNLFIDAEELIFEGNNEINLHHKFQMDTAVELEILNGANLSLKAKKSSGNVIIRMIGQEGKKGESTLVQSYKAVGYPARPAANGRNGADASFRDELSLMRDFENKRRVTVAKCSSQPGNGENGQDGIILHGTHGTQGGDTGNLLIDIEDYSKSKFTIFFVPGKGGQGGEANFPGQKGGMGGLAGKSQPPCGKAMNGSNGRDSVQADSRPGMDGEDGSIGQLIVPHIPQHFEVFTEINPVN